MYSRFISEGGMAMSFLDLFLVLVLGLLILVLVVAVIWNEVDPLTSDGDLHKRAPKEDKKK